MSELTQYTTDELSENTCAVIDDICSENFTSIGDKNGMFTFIEIFRTVSTGGLNAIRAELEETAELVGVDFDEFMQSMPDLERLIKR